MNYPCREKTIDEATGGPWFLFGTHSDGTVDISNMYGDVLREVPKDKAERIVAAHAVFMQTVYEELSLKQGVGGTK